MLRSKWTAKSFQSNTRSNNSKGAMQDVSTRWSLSTAEHHLVLCSWQRPSGRNVLHCPFWIIATCVALKRFCYSYLCMSRMLQCIDYMCLCAHLNSLRLHLLQHKCHEMHPLSLWCDCRCSHGCVTFAYILWWSSHAYLCMACCDLSVVWSCTLQQ